MDYGQILTDLHTQREQLDQAILTMERLARGAGKRRGRPPKWMTETKSPTAPERKRKPFSAETRKRMAGSQKKRWAKTA